MSLTASLHGGHQQNGVMFQCHVHSCIYKVFSVLYHHYGFQSKIKSVVAAAAATTATATTTTATTTTILLLLLPLQLLLLLLLLLLLVDALYLIMMKIWINKTRLNIVFLNSDPDLKGTSQLNIKFRSQVLLLLSGQVRGLLIQFLRSSLFSVFQNYINTVF